MADFSGVLNPKRVLSKREEDALKLPAAEGRSGEGNSLSPSIMSQTEFSRPFTAEEKARQNAQLAKILADRTR